jgi:hypothetical protein
MIRIKQKGSFNNTYKYLQKAKTIDLDEVLNRYGKLGVDALTLHTPSDSGETSLSWYYVIEKSSKGSTLKFCNSNTHSGANVAILIQYGYATKSGYRVEGRDYINPALEPIYESMVSEIEGKVRMI